MNHEIKFRLIKDGQIVGYERWNPEYRLWEYMACDPQGITPKGAIWMQPEIGYIEHDSKDWFTGLRDKNGWEIYEGDIIPVYENGEQYNYKVIYDGDCFMLSMLDSHQGSYPLSTKNLISEVIGNIHDNPDLLKGVIPCKE